MLTLLFLVLNCFLTESDAGYRLSHEKITLLDYNKTEIDRPVLVLFKYNVSTKAYNISGVLKNGLPEDFKIGVEAMRFQKNTYKPFPSRFAPAYCDMVARNDFGIRNMLVNGNLTECPIKPGYYSVQNFMIDDEKIPSQFLIPGRYKINGKLFSKDITYTHFEWFLAVVRY